MSIRHSRKRIFILVALLLGLGFLAGFSFQISETEQAVILQLGKPVREITKAGLHFKIPFLQEIVRLDKRLQQWDGETNEITTLDKRFLQVDTTARWRIIKPQTFLETVRNIDNAQSRIDDIIDSVTREVISRHKLIEAVRNTNRILTASAEADPATEAISATPEELTFETIQVGREKVQHLILEQAAPQIGEYGVELVDVRIRRLNYGQSVEEKVFSRMISEQSQIAEKVRSEGLGKKAEIAGRMQLELSKIESTAYRKAEELRGQADAQAAAIYTEAYGRDPEFFEYLQTLETYKQTIGANSTLFLSSDGELLKHLNP